MTSILPTLTSTPNSVFNAMETLVAIASAFSMEPGTMASRVAKTPLCSIFRLVVFSSSAIVLANVSRNRVDVPFWIVNSILKLDVTESSRRDELIVVTEQPSLPSQTIFCNSAL